ncbi:MAG: ATP-binding cassette domain-containing protein [Clostridiales bacterium]|nr:ATP-binding cassette domain-containing protein [Clostridiales bacterium]
MIEVSSLTKTYGKKRGIDRISFVVEEGDIVGFLGPNGAGKTTTMNIITGYLSANSGAARIGGVDVLEDPVEAKKKIGYLPEQPPLYLDMTVEEYLNFIFDLKLVKDLKRKKHLNEICELVGLTDHFKRLIRNLSKGYKQRVGLAQALIGNPEVLILDEPTVGLDPKQIIEIRNVIKNLGKNRTIILSTHILQEVSAICERVLVINNGQIVADDKPENLSALITGDRKLTVRVSGPRDSVRRVLRGVEGVQYAEATIQAERGSYDFLVEAQPNVDIRKPMFSALARSGYPILQLKSMELSLEDIFIKLVEEKKKSYVSTSKQGKKPKSDLHVNVSESTSADFDDIAPLVTKNEDEPEIDVSRTDDQTF